MKIQRSSNPVLFLSKAEKAQVTAAVRAAELKTSGEIRVHLERKMVGDVLVHAKKIFEKIGMTDTADRNGVLILLGVKCKTVVILGDSGINAKVPANYWDEEVRLLLGHFREDRFGEGLVTVIYKIGEKLQQFFPFDRQDVDELPNEISYSL